MFDVLDAFNNSYSYLSCLVVERLMKVLEGEDSMSFTPYNVMTNNCEHFASWARNGWIYSHQVVDVAKKVAAVNIFTFRGGGGLKKVKKYGNHCNCFILVKLSNYDGKLKCRSVPIFSKFPI